MVERKRLSVEAFDEIKFELRKYKRAACNLNLNKKEKSTELRGRSSETAKAHRG
eukprot:TRINITY_DN47_c0_g1_i4.p3 TRINITY_DN47_c0_g1~~TRINITY_DN47_c0_g1_i4.p3  ORF type:complete len:54 (-),score=35.76 TRINITY_DN47_c0_g1_i4:2-163(-)